MNLIGTLIAITPFILASLFFLTTPWINLTTIDCDRISPTRQNCFVYQSILGLKTQEIALADLQFADVKSKFSGRSGSQWLVIQTKQGEFKSNSFKLGSTTSEAAAQLNSFIENPNQAKVKITLDERLDSFVWSCVFLAGVPFILFLANNANP